MDPSMREARVLNSLFTAFGVPGIKLGQYLGFSSDLGGYKKALESLQDSAMPVSYLAAIQLIAQRWGNDWPTKYQIVRVLGTGSVNIAVEYEDLTTGRLEVANILRSDVEISVGEDFRKFNLVLDAILKDPVYGTKFAFIKGLSHVIEASVRLELDKKHAFEMQSSVRNLYNHMVDGWRVQTIDTIDVKNETVTMTKAPGISARKVLNEEPKAYREAMAALNKIEMNLIFGVVPGNGPTTLPLFANPDFHDGQVLIDAKNKIITILDFGQAVSISNAERAQAVEILRVISGAENVKSATSILNQILGTLHGERFDESEVKDLLGKGERMDIFIQLIAAFNKKKSDLPISVVHWILAVNRLSALGSKIGVNNNDAFRDILIARKLGITVSNYNGLRGTLERAKEWIFGQKVISSVTINRNSITRPVSTRSNVGCETLLTK